MISSPRILGRSCLIILVFQNLLYTICMRHVRSRDGGKFFPSSMMLISESLKMLTCVLVLHFTDGLWSSVYYLRSNFKDSVKTCVPALIYLIQNRLLVAALECLDAATFQVAYQLKLLTTALFSVLILRRTISSTQWFSLCLLFLGVSFVEPPTLAMPSKTLNPTLGLMYVICAAILSGFASIYFELVSLLFCKRCVAHTLC